MASYCRQALHPIFGRRAPWAPSTDFSTVVSFSTPQLFSAASSRALEGPFLSAFGARLMFRLLLAPLLAKLLELLLDHTVLALPTIRQDGLG